MIEGSSLQVMDEVIKPLIKIDVVQVGKEIKFKVDFSGDVLKEVKAAGKIEDLYTIIHSIKCSAPVYLGEADLEQLRRRGIMYLFELQNKPAIVREVQ